MQQIDLDTWSRKEQFQFFYKADYPQFNICMDLNISSFARFVKEHHLSFYYSMIFASTKIANEITNFRYRIRNGKQVVLHDSVNPSFTYIKPGAEEELFKIIGANMQSDIFEFNEYAKNITEAQTCFIEAEQFAERDNWLLISCIPWISFTHISHTITLNKDDSTPRITWGKYYHKDNEVMLPFSVQVHHALMDGYHIGKYVNMLQHYLSTF